MFNRLGGSVSGDDKKSNVPRSYQFYESRRKPAGGGYGQQQFSQGSQPKEPLFNAGSAVDASQASAYYYNSYEPLRKNPLDEAYVNPIKSSSSRDNRPVFQNTSFEYAANPQVNYQNQTFSRRLKNFPADQNSTFSLVENDNLANVPSQAQANPYAGHSQPQHQPGFQNSSAANKYASRSQNLNTDSNAWSYAGGSNDQYPQIYQRHAQETFPARLQVQEQAHQDQFQQYQQYPPQQYQAQQYQAQQYQPQQYQQYQPQQHQPQQYQPQQYQPQQYQQYQPQQYQPQQHQAQQYQPPRVQAQTQDALQHQLPFQQLQQAQKTSQYYGYGPTISQTLGNDNVSMNNMPEGVRGSSMGESSKGRGPPIETLSGKQKGISSNNSESKDFPNGLATSAQNPAPQIHPNTLRPTRFSSESPGSLPANSRNILSSFKTANALQSSNLVSFMGNSKKPFEREIFRGVKKVDSLPKSPKELEKGSEDGEVSSTDSFIGKPPRRSEKKKKKNKKKKKAAGESSAAKESPPAKNQKGVLTIDESDTATPSGKEPSKKVKKNEESEKKEKKDLREKIEEAKKEHEEKEGSAGQSQRSNSIKQEILNDRKNPLAMMNFLFLRAQKELQEAKPNNFCFENFIKSTSLPEKNGDEEPADVFPYTKPRTFGFVIDSAPIMSLGEKKENDNSEKGPAVYQENKIRNYFIEGCQRPMKTQESNIVTKLIKFTKSSGLGLQAKPSADSANNESLKEEEPKDDPSKEKEESREKTEEQVIPNSKVDSGEQQAMEDEEADEVENEQKFENRYFMENPTRFCFRCKRSGHFEKTCTEDISFKIQCFFCLGDHKTADCLSVICFKCNNVGHKIKECPLRNGADGYNIMCYRCQKRGHKSVDCNILILNKEEALELNREDEALIRCFNCNEKGHVNCVSLPSFLKKSNQRRRSNVVDNIYSEGNAEPQPNDFQRKGYLEEDEDRGRKRGRRPNKMKKYEGRIQPDQDDIDSFDDDFFEGREENQYEEFRRRKKKEMYRSRREQNSNKYERTRGGNDYYDNYRSFEPYAHGYRPRSTKNDRR